MLTEYENLKYQLESLSSYEPSDLDNPEFEVGYGDENGNEGFATVCCIDVANRALEYIKQLEAQQDDQVSSVMSWIDIKKELPEAIDGHKVLGHNGRYAFECEFDDGYWTNIGGEDMTHWMPLPKLTKKRG